VIVFAVISFVYFMPADMDGRILFRHDSAASKGLGHEKELFQQQTGETTRWTNSVFGGMPTYQMSPSYGSTQVLSQVTKAYHLWLPDYVWYVFVYLLGFYIMLRAFDFRQSLAALGSIIWAFALVREAGKRMRQERHFDVQLIGGLALCKGSIAEMRSRHFRMRLESRSDISGRKNWISVFTRQKHRHWTERQKMHLQRIMPLSNTIKMHAHTICAEIFIWIWEKKKRARQILRVLCSMAKKIMKSTLESMSL
jgi:hypothetical protein